LANVRDGFVNGLVDFRFRDFVSALVFSRLPGQLVKPLDCRELARFIRNAIWGIGHKPDMLRWLKRTAKNVFEVPKMLGRDVGYG
jgi:hypothetical protein